MLRNEIEKATKQSESIATTAEQLERRSSTEQLKWQSLIQAYEENQMLKNKIEKNN